MRSAPSLAIEDILADFAVVFLLNYTAEWAWLQKNSCALRALSVRHPAPSISGYAPARIILIIFILGSEGGALAP